MTPTRTNPILLYKSSDTSPARVSKTSKRRPFSTEDSFYLIIGD
ncbi:hypothetical protein K016_1463 [Acinetobacter baumannii 25569_10]|nr:hypothetical protein K016_1463 [Acinetobacter baumannii 25569_10]